MGHVTVHSTVQYRSTSCLSATGCPPIIVLTCRQYPVSWPEGWRGGSQDTRMEEGDREEALRFSGESGTKKEKG